MIRESSILAITKRSGVICMQDADIALTELRSELIIKIKEKVFGEEHPDTRSTRIRRAPGYKEHPEKT